MMQGKVERYLGLSRRAGNLIAGYDTCIEMIKRRKVKLMILTEDTSDKTKDKFLKLCERHKVPYYIYGTGDALSHMTGLPNRNIFGIIDENMAKAIESELLTMK